MPHLISPLQLVIHAVLDAVEGVDELQDPMLADCMGEGKGRGVLGPSSAEGSRKNYRDTRSSAALVRLEASTPAASHRRLWAEELTVGSMLEAVAPGKRGPSLQEAHSTGWLRPLSRQRLGCSK